MKRLLAAAAVASAASAAALLGFELLLRALGWSAPVWYQPDERLGWVMRPGVAGWYTREGRGFVEVNRSGRRDAEVPLGKPPEAYRIAVLGDSYTEAMQVAREEAFWALLPARLAGCGFAPGKRIEALNFGVSGYGTAQEYLTLEARALAYRPDLVLLQFTNGNDVRDNSRALEEERNRPFFRLEGNGALRADDGFASDPGFRSRASPASERLRGLTNHSRVLQLVRAARETPLIRKAQAGDGGAEQGLEPVVLAEPRDPAWQEAWRVTEALILWTAGAAHSGGARFALVTVPYAIQVHPDRKLREAMQAKIGVADLFYPDRRLAAFAERHGLLAVPLAPRMQALAEASGAYFHGFEGASRGRGHWNAAGHRAAADLIARELCERLR